MDMRLPPGLRAAASAEAPPPLRLLQRWTPAVAPQSAPRAEHGAAALLRSLRRLILAR